MAPAHKAASRPPKGKPASGGALIGPLENSPDRVAARTPSSSGVRRKAAWIKSASVITQHRKAEAEPATAPPPSRGKDMAPGRPCPLQIETDWLRRDWQAVTTG